MQNVSAQWNALFNAPHKTEYRFDINGVPYYGKDVKDTPVILKPLLDVPAIGRVCTGSLKLTIYPQSQDIPKAATVDAYCRLYSADGSTTSEWIPQGKYFVYNRSGKKAIVLNCLDRMVKAGTTYLDKSGIVNWPAPMQTVVSEICRIMDVTLDSRSVIKSGAPYYVDYPNEDTLISEVLSNIAAAHGGNWIVTESGQLRLIPLASPASTPVQDLGKTHRGYTTKGNRQTVSRIILTDSAENEFVSGDETGLTISAKCDYATQATANLLCSPFNCSIDNNVLRVTGATYDAGALDISSATAIGGTLTVFSKSAMYGIVCDSYTVEGAYISPAVELGDTIDVTDRENTVHRVVVQSVTMNCTVACTCTLSAGSEGETENEFPYISRQEMELSRSVKTNQTYFGNKINRSEGFVSELLVNGVAQARLVANASTFKMSAFKNGEWVDGIYFDPVEGKYVITGDVIINGIVTFNDLEQSGSTIINGDNIKTGTIKAERIDLSAYSTTEQINALITSSENGILATVNQTITKSMSDLESAIEKEMPKVFTDTPKPPYHVGDLWFGNAGNSYTAQNGQWVESSVSIPPIMCSDLDGTIRIYFASTVPMSYIRPSVGEYWYCTDAQKAFKCVEVMSSNQSPWQAIPDTSDIAVFLKSYNSQYVSSSLPFVDISLYCATTAPTIPIDGSDSLWYQPGTDIKVCITDNETDTFRASDWQKRDGYTDLPMLESLRAEIKIETDRITSTVSAQTTIINEQTGAIETLSQSVSTIEQTANSIELSVQTLSNQLDDKVSEGEVCAQIKLETTEGEGVVEIGADRLIVNSTNFKLDRNGTVSATGSFTTFSTMYNGYGYLITRISGGQIDFGYSTTNDSNYTQYNMSIIGSSPSYYGWTAPIIAMNSSMMYIMQPASYPQTQNICFKSGGAIECGPITVISQYSSSAYSLQVTGDGIAFSPNNMYNAVFLYSSSKYQNALTLSGSLEITGSIYLTGYKGRVVETENYGRRTLAAMESTLPVFSDMGRGKLDETGFALIALDDVFTETIETDYQYHVFLSVETENTSVYVSEYKPDYFTVSGDPGAIFSWLVFIPQKGYLGDRLPIMAKPDLNSPLEVDQSVFNTANEAMFQSRSIMERQTENAMANII